MINLPLPLIELAALCGGQVIGNPQSVVERICSIEDLQPRALTFVASAKAAKQAVEKSDTLFIVKPELVELIDNGISHDNPQQAIRRILVALTAQKQAAVIADSAVIAQSVALGNNVSIGANTVIGENVIIADHCRIGCGVVIESGTRIGQGTEIGHQSVIYCDTVIGASCVIGGGAVIGGQGFGFSFEGGQWKAIPQIGRVVIGNHVHIGANSCVDRGAINDTQLGDNVIIDNLVQIGHNVVVGKGTAMASGVGIAGSTTVGEYCLLAGKVGVNGHISITDRVQVNGGARVIKSIKESGVYAGSFDVQPVQKWNRIAVYVKKLETLFKREKNRDREK